MPVAASRVSPPALAGEAGCRPRVLSEEIRVLTVKKLYGDKSIPVSEICKTLNISRSTYYRYVALKSQDTPEAAG